MKKIIATVLAATLAFGGAFGNFNITKEPVTVGAWNLFYGYNDFMQPKKLKSSHIGNVGLTNYYYYAQWYNWDTPRYTTHYSLIHSYNNAIFYIVDADYKVSPLFSTSAFEYEFHKDRTAEYTKNGRDVDFAEEPIINKHGSFYKLYRSIYDAEKAEDIYTVSQVGNEYWKYVRRSDGSIWKVYKMSVSDYEYEVLAAGLEGYGNRYARADSDSTRWQYMYEYDLYTSDNPNYGDRNYSIFKSDWFN